LVWICSGKTQIEKKESNWKKKHKKITLSILNSLKILTSIWWENFKLGAFDHLSYQKKIDEGWEKKIQFCVPIPN
jgi:hypothetical protein